MANPVRWLNSSGKWVSSSANYYDNTTGQNSDWAKNRTYIQVTANDNRTITFKIHNNAVRSDTQLGTIATYSASEMLLKKNNSSGTQLASKSWTAGSPGYGDITRDVTNDGTTTFWVSWNTTAVCVYNYSTNYGASSSGTKTVSFSNPFFTVIYNKNCNDTVTNMPSNANTVDGQSYTLDSATPARAGYTFLGWSTNSSATSASYQPSSSYGTISGNVTFYAVWKITTYTITYNANGGSGAPASQTKDYGATITLSETIPSWTGRNFKGWAESSTGSVVYQPGASYSDNANLSLYAIWELQTWKITYDANGGSGAPASQTKIYGTDLTLSGVRPSKASQSADSYIVTLNGNNGSVSPSQLTAARTSNYSFNIWNTKSNGSGTNYSPSQNYSTNASLDLYAQWNTNTTTASVALPTNPSRTGYAFLGWNESASASTGITGYYTPTGNVTLYAIWKTQSKIYIDNNLVTNAYLGVVPIKKIYLNETVLFEQD